MRLKNESGEDLTLLRQGPVDSGEPGLFNQHIEKDIDGGWKEIQRVFISDGNGKHKPGSLAYDPVKECLFSAVYQVTAYQISI